MSIIDEPFWTKDPSYLLKPIIFPESHMTMTAQLNAISRLIIVIGLILFALKFKFSLIFIILSLSMIIILYYCQMSQYRENYSPSNFPQLNYPFENFKDIIDNKCPNASVPPPEHLSFEQANKLSTYNKTEVGVDFFSPPIQIQERSMIPPIIVPKAYDKSVWTYTDGADQTGVNKRTMEDVTVNFMTNENNCPTDTRMDIASLRKVNPFKLTSTDQNTIPSYASDYLNLPTDTLFKQDIQPKDKYNYYVERHQPINGNYAISEIPNWEESPEKKYTEFEMKRHIETMPNKQGWAQMSAYSPQLIRDDGPMGRQVEMPVRTEWSARVSPYEIKGNIDYDRVFDPRFTGYGDPYSSYLDKQKGNISYYYGDTVDAYRNPVFISRSKVDFIEDREPMGQIKPMFRREKPMCLGDAIEGAEDRWMTDTTSFRESLIGSQMTKANAEAWQKRYFPMRLMNSK